MRPSKLFIAPPLVAAMAFVGTMMMIACGARSTLKAEGGPRASGGGPSSTNTGGSPDGGAGGFGGDGGTAGEGGDGGMGGEGGGPGECVVFNSVAALAPADLFLMLDRSGSMAFTLPNGATKWSAVTDALGSFFADPDSKGMDASLAFYPIYNDSIPQFCDSDTECGAPNTCMFPQRLCPTAGRLCFDDGDCDVFDAPDDTCQDLGRCNNGQLCLPSGDGGFTCPTGPCTTPVGGCDNRSTCDVGAYSPSQSGLVSLPAGAPTLEGILNSQPLIGGTPTRPALAGVLQAALNNAFINPSHKSFVILVTDGFPTACDPDLYGPNPDDAIDNLRAIAAGGFASDIQTFVIGVFGPLEEAQAEQNLGLIASAGGTDEAFVISTQGNVSGELLLALNEVRAEIQACEFELVTEGEEVDFSTVWVRVHPDQGEPVWVEFVGDASGCDPVTGGFYYDIPLSQGTPSRVVLCPRSCDLVTASDDPNVEVFTACDPTDDDE